MDDSLAVQVCDVIRICPHLISSMTTSQLFRLSVGPTLELYSQLSSILIAGFLSWNVYSQPCSGLLGGHVLLDEHSVGFPPHPFDSLNPSGRPAAGIYHNWVWQGCASHCPMQGRAGRLRRLLWHGSELVSPQGKHGFKLWPACLPHGMYVDPGFSQYNSTTVFWVFQLCFPLSLFYCAFRGAGFLRYNTELLQRTVPDGVIPRDTTTTKLV